MLLTVLGCQSPYPGPGGATAGYLVETARTRLLLDCGSGVISQLTRHLPLYELDALVLSHYHHDHVADLGVLQYGLMMHQAQGERPRDEPLPVYAPATSPEYPVRVDFKTATRHVPIDAASTAEAGDIRLWFWRTEHPVPCYAVKIQSGGRTLVYGADSGPGTAWSPFADGADLFICEGTYLSHNRPAQPNGHMSVREAAQTAQRLRAKALLITHLYHGYDREQVRKEASDFVNGPCHVAAVGLKLEI